jgi:hypothetical protein
LGFETEGLDIRVYATLDFAAGTTFMAWLTTLVPVLAQQNLREPAGKRRFS